MSHSSGTEIIHKCCQQAYGAIGPHHTCSGCDLINLALTLVLCDVLEVRAISLYEEVLLKVLNCFLNARETFSTMTALMMLVSPLSPSVQPSKIHFILVNIHFKAHLQNYHYKCHRKHAWWIFHILWTRWPFPSQWRTDTSVVLGSLLKSKLCLRWIN